MLIRDLPSPNHDARPEGVPVDMLILHYTGMRDARSALDRLRDPAALPKPVSSHYVVEEDGTVWRLVPEARRAWHAGVSHWRGREALNGRSVGIEIVNPGHEFGYRPFPVLQMAAVCDLCLEILGRYPIAPIDVVGHSDVAPDRKQDPGELFPWEELAANGVGLWPAALPAPPAPPAGAAPAAMWPRAAALLGRIGYPLATPSSAALALVAFQRHWRPERVDGMPDPGTMARLEAVADAAGV
ncbi:N-acetylmuramoyl-L-alanine amidase [Roseomonas sp. NAR14]|uniref:N-acetylmuramoyl-L-alanine amidase n=1 Tax=Roseomonas acroporae TaxID=2937791 RepID=A0A9X2BTD6_9PROT|nr:N-acetylmuramoyl-L-alanine amidase [Roseomonas acroporae]MCK8783116.1 N-acetylmuramoyl-L-alanine amidase [Roseomonas acroporae]